jgi:hypothetical protein
MKTDRWRMIEEIFHNALERDFDERRNYLDQVCAFDQLLRTEVESLLSSNDEAKADNFLNLP